MDFGTKEILYSVILFITILLSAFFAAGEISFMRANRFRIRTLSDKGSKDARRVEEILKDPDRLISSILLGNNFVNILGSALATALLMDLLGEEGIFLASVIMTIVLLIFAEITPKTIAAYRADDLAMIFSKPVAFFIRILGPVAHVLASISRGLLSFVRFKAGDTDRVTEEDVESVITMGHKEGFIQESKARMLVAVLDLDAVPVRKVMHPLTDMDVIPAESTFDDIVDTIATKNYTRYPVYEEDRDNITGYIHIRDIWAYIDRRESFRIQDILQEAYFIPDTKPVLKQLIDFQKKRQHMAFVVDEYGTVKGGITLEDIIEEITGDIADEHDALSAHVIPVTGGLVVRGNIGLRDLGRYMERDFPEDLDTLSGLIYEQLDRIPAEGDVITWQDMTFIVERMRGNRVSRVRITVAKPE